MRRTSTLLLLTAPGLLALAGCSSDDAKPGAAPTVTVTVTAEPAVEEEEEPAAPELTADDFNVRVKVKEKQCFGSAGCNVTIEVVPTVTDPSLVEDVSVEVTYRVAGLEDGALIGTFEFDDGQYTTQEHMVSTTSSAANITAKVTDVYAY